MGKTKVAVIGEDADDSQKKQKYEERKARKREQEAKKKEEAAKSKEKTNETASKSSEGEKKTEVKEEAKEEVKTKTPTKKSTSKRHNENRKEVIASQKYPLDKAIKILKKFKTAKFDETVELHLNVKEKGTSGQIDLPHGTGKKRTIKIASEDIIKQVEKGKIDFDVLVATPDIMPKLAKVARVLGPRGLMPNPKNGTITKNPAEVVKNLEKGQLNYKTEPKAPIIHLSVGKVSFEEKQLEENINTIVDSVGAKQINSLALTASMSPSIKLDEACFSKKK